jgi:hypothetical protein
MNRESDIVPVVLRVLRETPDGTLPTGEVRRLVRERLILTREDLAPLRNRPDQRIDQIIRNLKSHKKVAGNPFHDGLLQDVPRGFAITEIGRSYSLDCSGRN